MTTQERAEAVGGAQTERRGLIEPLILLSPLGKTERTKAGQ
jgi:hypothetical protein